MPAPLLSAINGVDEELQREQTADQLGISVRLVLVQRAAYGDIHVQAVGALKKVAPDSRGGLIFYLNEDAILPGRSEEGARMLSTLQLSLPRYVTAKIDHVARDGLPRVIPMRDFQIIRSGKVFYHATVIQSILDEFDLPIVDKRALFQVKGQSPHEVWSRALERATTLLYEQLVVPTEFAYQAAVLWEDVAKSGSAVDRLQSLTFAASDTVPQTQQNDALITINIGEVKKLRQTLGSEYAGGSVYCGLIEEIRNNNHTLRRLERDFMERFPYPGNLRL